MSKYGIIELVVREWSGYDVEKDKQTNEHGEIARVTIVVNKRILQIKPDISFISFIS